MTFTKIIKNLRLNGYEISICVETQKFEKTSRYVAYVKKCEEPIAKVLIKERISRISQKEAIARFNKYFTNL